MTRRALIVTALTAMLLALAWTGWLVFGRTEEEQVLARQEALFRAVERRDWDAVREMLDPGYSDSADQDGETAVATGRQALAPFYTLTLGRTVTRVEVESQRSGRVECEIRLEGSGAGYTQAVVEAVNSMSGPWFFEWRRTGGRPWDWKLWTLHHDQLRQRAAAAGWP